MVGSAAWAAAELRSDEVVIGVDAAHLLPVLAPTRKVLGDLPIHLQPFVREGAQRREQLATKKSAAVWAYKTYFTKQ